MQSRNVVPGIPNTSRSPVESFGEVDPYFPERNLQIVGVTKDSAGAPLGDCTLVLLNKNGNIPMGPFMSDGSGNYSIPIPTGLNQPQTETWRVDASKLGSPDVSGSIINPVVS